MKISIRTSAAAAVLAVLFGAQAALAQDPTPKGEPELIGAWSGSFRPGTMSGSMSRGSSGSGAPGRYSGNINIIPSQSGAPGSYRFSVVVSSNVNNSETLEWGISNGRCGSKLIMLVGSNSFPTIEMRSGGTGDVSTEVAMQFTAKGAFQAVLFKGGHQQQNIVACANLKFSEGRK